MVSTVLTAIAAKIVNSDWDSNWAYTMSPTPAGIKKTAMFFVITVAVLLTFSGSTILKKRARKRSIMPITLPGIKP